MIQTGKTPGEQLCWYLCKNFVDGRVWTDLTDRLSFMRRENEYVELFRQMVSVSVTGRLVYGAKSLFERLPQSDRIIGDALFNKQVRELIFQMLNDVNSDQMSSLIRFVERSVEASNSSLSPRRFEDFRRKSIRERARCYMCNAELDFNRKEKETKYRWFTIDHIWPRSYGGDSEDTNLLAACADCNSEKKGNFSTWAMINVQSLIGEVDPSAESLETIVNGRYRFALHCLAAQRLANKMKLSLKDAFQRLGPWSEIRILDNTFPVEFFNLEIHQE